LQFPQSSYEDVGDGDYVQQICSYREFLELVP